MIRTITVEEEVLKQQGADKENEETSVQTSKLKGNYYGSNIMLIKIKSILVFMLPKKSKC